MPIGLQENLRRSWRRHATPVNAERNRSKLATLQAARRSDTARPIDTTFDPIVDVEPEEKIEFREAAASEIQSAEEAAQLAEIDPLER